MRHSRLALGSTALLALIGSVALAAPEDNKAEGTFEPFKPRRSPAMAPSRRGTGDRYQAIAGTLIVHPKGWDDVPRDPKEKAGAGGAEDGGETHNPTAEASMFYVAYFKSGAAAAPGDLPL